MYLRKLITTTFMFMLLIGTIAAQDVTMNIQEDAQMRIDGDSNVRSWGADVKDVNGNLVLAEVDELTLENLSADLFKELTLTIPVESLDSGSRGLTNNMKKYLKGDDYPEITFTLSDVTNIQLQGESAIITADGVINAAGVDNNVTMEVTASLNSDGSMNFRGEKEILMTDFNIDPPTAVLGTVKSDNEVLITFNVNFN